MFKLINGNVIRNSGISETVLEEDRAIIHSQSKELKGLIGH